MADPSYAIKASAHWLHAWRYSLPIVTYTFDPLRQSDLNSPKIEEITLAIQEISDENR